MLKDIRAKNGSINLGWAFVAAGLMALLPTCELNYNPSFFSKRNNKNPCTNLRNLKGFYLCCYPIIQTYFTLFKAFLSRDLKRIYDISYKWYQSVLFLI
jgi:hypothetical protein